MFEQEAQCLPNTASMLSEPHRYPLGIEVFIRHCGRVTLVQERQIQVARDVSTGGVQRIRFIMWYNTQTELDILWMHVDTTQEQDVGEGEEEC